MLDTAIVGGGLCGVALARNLQGQGREFALFEARPRLGGRILSVACRASGMALDLGPSWFWPETQPLIKQLVGDLGLEDFAQHDDGVVLHLRDADKTPERIQGSGVHNGARRLEGGMASLIAALARDVPQERLRFDHVLVDLSDLGDHVALAFRVEGQRVVVEARRVVLTIPPRLLEEQVRFDPDLDDTTRTTVREAGTWMAAQAKVAIGYRRPYWREVGQSGNAFVRHEQAVIGEIFDACDSTATKAAVGGFVSLSPPLRRSFSDGLSMLLESQMVQVFGPALEKGEQHYQDWATEAYTCSALDRDSPQTDHVGFANPLLRRVLWNGKLYLGGSETASHGAGYLEGALDAARRIERELDRAAAAEGKATARDSGTASGEAVSVNAASLAQFSAWVGIQRDETFEGYRHRLNRGLAAQQREQLTQRAVLGSMEEVYAKALGMLEGLAFDMSEVAVERGRSALTPEVQKPFREFMQSIMDDVVAYNRTSCALSNFPDEHRLSGDYMQTILRDIAAAWQEFSLSANRLFLAKMDKMEMSGGRRRHDGPDTGVAP
jgi:monoamine oxidase